MKRVLFTIAAMLVSFSVIYATAGINTPDYLTITGMPGQAGHDGEGVPQNARRCGHFDAERSSGNQVRISGPAGAGICRWTKSRQANTESRKGRFPLFRGIRGGKIQSRGGRYGGGTPVKGQAGLDWGNGLPLNEAEEFYKSDEAIRIGDQVLLYQRMTGGWPKNTNMSRPLSEEERGQVLKDKSRRDDSTIDNDATSMQMTYLARLWQATKAERYKEAFGKAVEYLLDGQYDNGGWPQFWPEMSGYQKHITYNDDAMVNTMDMLKAVANQDYPYKGMADKTLRRRCQKAFDKGVECILATQILQDGVPTIWCQQHDRETLLPASARAYELPSYCPQESSGIVLLLMQIEKPDERIKRAVHSAMAWFDKYKLTGFRVERTGEGAFRNTRLVKDQDATPLWARFYDLEYCEPYVCDRDGIPRRHLEEIGTERRSGYSWYGNRPAALYPIYEQWAEKNDPGHKLNISLSTKGANENGTIQMFRRPKIDPANFDAVVSEGESIQEAVDKAPQNTDLPYKILIRKGIYPQKVIIDRPNIMLVGEQKDSTVIILAETAATLAVKEYHGKPVHNGVLVLQEGADDCIISGLTIYNNYGTAVDPGNTTHQMAVFGRATRTIILNCNIWADGNDALSLWAPEGNGMYYHADLSLRCKGIDFLCPRGWCYATRCSFYGDGHAIIWHDGRGDPDKKLVITNSAFDAGCPTALGRYHHDSQFYLIKCQLSGQILDENIRYAYTDKVLDPCPWGRRVYYYGCSREGGAGPWLGDNLSEAQGSPAFYGITAEWTFGGRWNPEARIREIWKILNY